MNGLFVTFEGIDGSGKSTVVAAVADLLTATGDEVVVTFEPGDTPVGRQLRDILLADDVHPVTAALLFAADRSEHVRQVIVPALHRGAVVLCDRYEASNVAYQGRWRGVGVDAVTATSRFASDGLTPHLTVLLDLPADVAARRRGGDHPDELDRTAAAAADVIVAAYADAAAADPDRWLVVDATRPAAETARIVADTIRTLPRTPQPAPQTSSQTIRAVPAVAAASDGAARVPGRLMVVAGPSGAGKNTLVERLVAERDDVWYSVSVTTRPARPGETDGEAYHFVDDARFDRLVAGGKLLEAATYDGYRYGTPSAPVDRRLEEGVHVVAIVELSGVAAIRTARPDTVVVFVTLDVDELHRRIVARGDGDDTADRRVTVAVAELAEGPNVADVVVDGADLTAAVAAVSALLPPHGRS